VPEPVRLEPWGEDDLPLLEQLLGDPAMTEHLGGPESPEKIVERQARYVKAESGLFKIVHEETGEGVGWVGYWDKTWREQAVYEIGWAVLPAFHGRGIAGTATAQAIAEARFEQRHRFVHAFPRSTTRRRTRSAGSLASRCSGSASSSTPRAALCSATIADRLFD
jgi:RimJ/RimL family protein N-acetyltransferase